MDTQKAKRPLTLQGALALVAAGLLYVVAQALGLDLGAAGAGTAEGARGPGAPSAARTADSSAAPAAPEPAVDGRRDDTQLIQQLFRSLASGRIVEAEGRVVHVLPLDEDGSRHQNFLLELANGITLKVSHNIDLAPALPGLQKGDRVRFHGQYEHNEKGGVVHWTHRDPAGRHEHGWLEHKGRRYE